MNEAAHRYDVAFSFLTVDLSAAEQLADRIDPLSSFVFRRQQEEIAGGDGMEKFGSVFGAESRVNVVLYRNGYGEKGWTGYECQVIKSRCLRDGWDGFLLLRMDDSVVPKWVPPTYIYGDIATMDVSGLAGVIRHRAKMIGIDVRRQTTADRIARHARQLDFDAETEALATGSEAFAVLRSNQQKIYDRIGEHVSGVPETIGGDAGFGAGVFGANLGRIGFLLNYKNPYGAVSRGSLLLRFFRDRICIPGTQQMRIGDPEEVRRVELAVARTNALGWCWVLEDDAVTSEQVADFVVDEMLRLNQALQERHWADRP